MTRRRLALVGFSLLVAWFILSRIWAAYLWPGLREGVPLRAVWTTLSILGKLSFAGIQTLFWLGLALLLIAVFRRTK